MNKLIAGGLAVALIGTGYSFANQGQDAIATQDSTETDQKFYDCRSVNINPEFDSRQTDSMEQDTVDRVNYFYQHAAFWHEWGAENCMPYAQHLMYNDGFSTGISEFVYSSRLKSVYVVTPEGVVKYTQEDLEKMGLNEYREYIESRKAMTDQLSADNVPDGPERDSRIKEIENFHPPDNGVGNLVNHIQANGGTMRAGYLFASFDHPF